MDDAHNALELRQYRCPPDPEVKWQTRTSHAEALHDVERVTRDALQRRFDDVDG
jgi:hypothetical protein